MITTNNSYLKQNFFASEEHPVYHWRCVDLEINSPYYFLEYIQKENSSRLSARKIVSDLADLIEMCQAIKRDAKLQLVRISLLSPSWLNKSHMWELASLSEVHYGNFGQKEPWVQIFKLQDGRQLFDPSLKLDIEDAQEVHCQFLVTEYM
ncbi:hypothetical protein ACO0LF_30760 [Undibacterium sp. Di27W]|uniref:hypothetical protein n=1 Tax=Undibacterium sp. Di27W TaxID=3413036 RepID=UPI003BF3E7B4